MRKNTSFRSTINFPVIYTIALASIVTAFSACNKSRPVTAAVVREQQLRAAVGKPLAQSQEITSVVTVANIRTSGDGKTARVMFLQNPQILNVTDAADIAMLKTALDQNQPVMITFDPWQAKVSHVVAASQQDKEYFNSKPVIGSPGTAITIDRTTSAEIIDRQTAAMGVLDITTPGLTNVIPDFATAQQTFDYMAHQCCQLPGPYTLDHCITFQYCPDGCYARAHKMCWIMNKKYHYGTQKVFSFANAGIDELCVKAQKWNGCCINWWYHVAPLVTIKTPTGPKAYVFDPAMFDQPVLLSTWLHFQQNPDCVPTGSVPHVSMINIQPTSAYSPASYSGYSFDTDPTFYYTNSTLVSYENLISCP